MKNSFDHFVQILYSFSQSENPRIKHAALTSIALFSTYFSPFLQISYHQIIIPCIINCLNPSNLSKVTIQALKCMINFCNGLTTDDELCILIQYTPALIQCYNIIFTSSTTSIQLLQELLSSLSVFSLTVLDFNPYSPLFLAKLRTIFYENACYTDDLKNSAIKCIGCIIQATQTSETEAIFIEMIKIKELMGENSPCYSNIMEVLVKCVTILKERSIEYCSNIIQELLRNANSPVDYVVVDSETEVGHLLKGIHIPLRGLGDKKVAISTTALENKINACKLIHLLIKSLGKLYSPWVMETLHTISPLINFQMNPEVRKFSFKVITALPLASSYTQIDSLVLNCFPYLANSIAEKIETFPEDVNKMIIGMVSIGEKVQSLSVLGLAGASKLSELLAESVKKVYIRKNTRKNLRIGINDPSLYTEELETMEDAEKIDEEILRNSVDMIGLLLKSFKKQFQGCFNIHFQGLFGELFSKPNASNTELISSLCLFCDYVEHTGDLLENNSTSPLLQEFVKLCYHNNADIRQCAVFGIGLAAVYGNKQLVSKYLDPCIDACKAILSSPSAMSEECITCTECAAGTIGKLSIYYKEELASIWIAYLPFKSDPEEAIISHQLFLDNFDRIKKYPEAYKVLNAMKKVPNEFLSNESLSMIQSIA